MRRYLSKLGSSLLVCTLLSPAAHAAEAGPLEPAKTVRSVWSLSSQPCNGGGANAYARHPDEKSVQAAKKIDLPQIGYSFAVPQIPEVDETVLKVRLDDRSRGVIDHYLLLADQDLEAPFGAIVVTPMPAGMQEREHAFKAAKIVQTNLAKAVGISPELSSVPGAYGDSLEMVVPGRVGTHCFPTSDFRLVPPEFEIRTLGISRFAFHNNNLVEFSLVLAIPDHIDAEGEVAYARSIMDRFWLALGPI